MNKREDMEFGMAQAIGRRVHERIEAVKQAHALPGGGYQLQVIDEVQKELNLCYLDGLLEHIPKRTGGIIRSRLSGVMAKHYVVRVVDVVDEDYLYLYDYQGEQATHSTDVSIAVERTPIKWVIHGLVPCRDQNGQQYIKRVELPAPYACKRSQIMASVADALFEFVDKQCNPLHVLTVAWLAGAEGSEPTDDMIDRILTDRGVWSDYMTAWEAGDNGPNKLQHEKPDV